MLTASDILYVIGAACLVTGIAGILLNFRNRGKDWRPNFVRWWFKNHLSVFLSCMMASVYSTPFLVFALNSMTVSLPLLSLFIGSSMALTTAFHIGAYDLTTEAIRRKGLSVEKNPIARFMFGRFGFKKTLWLTSLLLPAIMLTYSLAVRIPGDIIALGSVVVVVNFLDWANDQVAIHTLDYFLSHATHGLPAFVYLPCPALKKEDISTYTIGKLWS
jgi:hypothetical protein